MDSQFQQSLHRHLSAKVGTPRCPMCGEDKFTVIGPFALSSLAASTWDRGKLTSVDGLGCNSCGAITFIAHASVQS